MIDARGTSLRLTHRRKSGRGRDWRMKMESLPHGDSQGGFPQNKGEEADGGVVWALEPSYLRLEPAASCSLAPSHLDPDRPPGRRLDGSRLAEVRNRHGTRDTTTARPRRPREPMNEMPRARAGEQTRGGLQADATTVRRGEHLWRLTASATFCVEPAGDSPTRSHLYIAVLLGCIPVIIDGDAPDYHPSPLPNANAAVDWTQI